MERGRRELFARQRPRHLVAEAAHADALGVGHPGRAQGQLARGPVATRPWTLASSAREEAADVSGLVRPRRLSWPELMRRVFAIDVLECPRCGGAIKILAAIHPPETTAAILACLGLPTHAPPTEPARAEVGAAPQDSSAADW
jgi:hypothetical protein